MFHYYPFRPPPATSRRWRSNVEAVAPNCPRCDSSNTKFCYYNNYCLMQPRYFCKGCRRYWTEGGSLRDIPVGGSSRKNRREKLKKPNSTISTPAVPIPALQNSFRLDHGPERMAGETGARFPLPSSSPDSISIFPLYSKHAFEGNLAMPSFDESASCSAETLTVEESNIMHEEEKEEICAHDTQQQNLFGEEYWEIFDLKSLEAFL